MRPDAIVQKILEDARRDAAKTLDEANTRAEALKRQSEERLRVQREALSEQTKQDAAALRGRMLRMAELEARKARLAAKREVIDQVFDTVLGGMKSMPQAQRMAYNRRILLEAARGGETILCDGEDVELFPPSFIDDVNARLARAGKRPVRLGDERRKLGGGFVLRDGGMEIHCRYDRIIAEQRPSLEADVARMLFDDREVD